MDPMACWNDLKNAALSGDLLTARDLAEDLDGWRRKGGYRPEGIPLSAWGKLRDFARVCEALAGQ